MLRSKDLPLLFPQSHSHDTSQATQDARHAVQIVHSAGVLYAQVGSQDGLQKGVKVKVDVLDIRIIPKVVLSELTKSKGRDSAFCF